MKNKRNRILVIAKDKKIYSGQYVTGGQKYSKKLINEISRTYAGELVILDDSDFHAKGNIIDKIQAYRENIKLFDGYDLVYFSATHYQVALVIKSINKLFPHTIVVSEMHHLEYQSFMPVSLMYHIIKWLERYILRICDYIVIPNDYPADYVIKHRYADSQKIIRINNVFERKPHKVTNGSSNQLLYVGTVEPRKGIEFLINSLQYVKRDYVLNIIGKYDAESKYWMSIKKLISKYGIESKVHFLGRVPQEELNKYYEHARAFVFPSLNEGYGLAVLEAMGYGLPVIAFANTAMPYTIKNDYNGYLTKNKDVRGFGENIEKVLSIDEEKYNALSKAAIKTFEETKTEEDLKNQVSDFINKVLVGKPPCPQRNSH